MQNAQRTVESFSKITKCVIICLSLSITACQKQPTTSTDTQEKNKDSKVEFIQQDLVKVQQGSSISKSSFIGTIRAINQSSIQAQVTATATNVTAQVGQKVSQEQVLVHLNNQDNAARLAQSRANLASTQAQAKQAQNMVQRKKRLYDQGFISKVEYEQSQVDYQAQLENVKAQQANVDISLKANQDGILKSPISGVITKRQVEPGQTVSIGQTLFEIVDPDHLEIQAKLPTEQQSALKIGSQIQYNIQGNPQKLTATLSRISPIADQNNRQIEFFAQPNETITSLSIGAFIEGAIFGSNPIQGQLIPLDTIQDIQNKPFVWVVRNNKVQQIPLQILEQRTPDNIAIVKGLQDQDLISRVKLHADDINKPVVISTP